MGTMNTCENARMENRQSDESRETFTARKGRRKARERFIPQQTAEDGESRDFRGIKCLSAWDSGGYNLVVINISNEV